MWRALPSGWSVPAATATPWWSTSSSTPFAMGPPTSCYSGHPALRPSGPPSAVRNRSRRFRRALGRHRPPGRCGASSSNPSRGLARPVRPQCHRRLVVPARVSDGAEPGAVSARALLRYARQAHQGLAGSPARLLSPGATTVSASPSSPRQTHSVSRRRVLARRRVPAQLTVISPPPILTWIGQEPVCSSYPRGGGHAPAPRFSRTPSAIRCRPPYPGEGGDEALTEWGFASAEIAALRGAGALG
jgi:hypothetical protein